MAAKKGCFHPGCPAVITEGSFCEDHKKKQWKENTKKARETSQREQQFYNTTLWRNTSKGFRSKHPNCRECARKGLDIFADEVDHILPLKIAWHLRMTPSNFQSLCRSCHASKRALEAQMYEDNETPGKTVIVSGPPGSGKTTYVLDRMRPGDLVLDLDRLFAAISFQDLYQRKNEQVLLGYALAARDGIIEKAVLAGGRRPNFWFIIGAPNPIERQRFQEIFKAEVVVLAVPKEICLARIAKTKERQHQVDKMREVVAQWWFEFEPRHEFETIYEG